MFVSYQTLVLIAFLFNKVKNIRALIHITDIGEHYEIDDDDNHEIFGVGETLTQDRNVHELIPGTEKLLSSHGTIRLEIFCYKGEPQSIATLLKTVELVVKVPKDNFYYFEGANVSSVRHQYKDQSWLSFTPWKPNSFRLNVYNYSCVGILTVETFIVQLKIRHVDLWRVVTLSVGTSIFLSAPILAHNAVFHYVTGVSVGIFGSLLVVVFLVSRLMPKKIGALTVLIGGWGLALYTLQYVWINCLNFVKEYQAVAAGYVTLVGLISFAIVYRWGPIEDVRSIRLVQWSLQLMGLTLIFVSSQYKEFTLAVILTLLAYYNVPHSWKSRLKTYWFRRFPPKRSFLTEDEYLEQTRQETKKALEELREFSHSPDCNAWRMMTRLRSPQRYAERSILSSENLLVSRRPNRRYAEFVEGNCHITDDEILAYENTHYFEEPGGRTNELMLTDDDDEPETNIRFRKCRN